MPTFHAAPKQGFEHCSLGHTLRLRSQRLHRLCGFRPRRRALVRGGRGSLGNVWEVSMGYTLLVI